jgi:acyl-CoA thioester hydrolase
MIGLSAGVVMRENPWSRATASGKTEIRVRVADTDLMGVVYNGNFLVWFEIGRTELLRDLGLTYAEVEARGYSLPVTEARFRARKPAHYDDKVVVETRLGSLRTREVRFLYRIHRGEDLLVEGETTHVPVCHRNGAAVSIPGWMATVLGRSGGLNNGESGHTS